MLQPKAINSIVFKRYASMEAFAPAVEAGTLSQFADLSLNEALVLGLTEQGVRNLLEFSVTAQQIWAKFSGHTNQQAYRHLRSITKLLQLTLRQPCTGSTEKQLPFLPLSVQVECTQSPVP